jgi:AcrR family transcriptional regulator
VIGYPAGVPRPRVHDLDAILDAAEELLAAGPPAALTIRSLADATGASSGSLYHAFGSRNELLGRLWARAAADYLAELRRGVDAALDADGRTPSAAASSGHEDAGHDAAVEATIAAATTLARLREARPTRARLLVRHRREELVGTALSPGLAEELHGLQRGLDQQLRRLAGALWRRGDRPALEVVAACVVDLPVALLVPRRPRVVEGATLVRSAVRGLLADPPPAATGGGRLEGAT